MERLSGRQRQCVSAGGHEANVTRPGQLLPLASISFLGTSGGASPNCLSAGPKVLKIRVGEISVAALLFPDRVLKRVAGEFVMWMSTASRLIR